jgi:glycosyltransferase involved in cell wall biosynthesis
MPILSHRKKMNDPLFSIIIPCYNAAHTIAQTLTSIQKQTLTAYEVIAADGGSTDDTIAIIKSTLPNAITFSEPDHGVYDAINKGIKKATGKYIYIIGSDDFLENNHVLDSVAKLTESSPDVIYGDVQYVHKINRLVPDKHHSQWNAKIYWKNTLHQQGCFYKKEIFNTLLFNPQYKVLGDYDFHLFLFTNSYSNIRYDAVVAVCEAQGLSKNFKFDLYREELKIKKIRLPLSLYLMNVIWVRLKYLAKNLF